MRSRDDTHFGGLGLHHLSGHRDGIAKDQLGLDLGPDSGGLHSFPGPHAIWGVGGLGDGNPADGRSG